MSDATVRLDPAMTDIAAAQDGENNLRRQAAARAFYARAKLFQAVGTAFSLVLALLAPIVLLLAPDAGATLGAVAGIWLFVTRLALQPLRERLRLAGVAAQEAFDCDVLGLDWNASLTKKVADEEIRGQTRRTDLTSFARWYPTGQDMPWPTSVLTCQRSNAVWARRQHGAYGWVLVIAAISWGVIGVGIALAHGATLATYLVAIALPSLPALLDFSELARDHFDATSARLRLEEVIDAQLAAPSSIRSAELRENQDQLFALRRDAPLVPEWFYHTVAGRFDDEMRFAAAQRAQDEGGNNGDDKSSL